MARLASALTVVLAVMAMTVLGHATLKQPDVPFASLTPGGASFDNCWATTTPAVLSPSSIFMAYTCGTGSGTVTKVSHLDMVRRMSGLKWNISANAAIVAAPIPVNPVAVLAYTKTAVHSKLAYVEAALPHPRWVNDRYGAQTEVAYDPVNERVFYTSGRHQGTFSGQSGEFTTLTAANVSSGDVVWQRPFSPVAKLSTPIYYEGRVMMLEGNTLYSYHASTDNPMLRVYQKTNPCGMSAAPGSQLQMKLVTYDQGSHTALNALLIYGAQPDTTNGGHNYSICRLHHGSWDFGDREWGHAHTGINVDIHQITGGAGFIFVSQYNHEVQKYQILILNGTVTQQDQDPWVAMINRSSTDKYSYPSVMTDDYGQNPIMVASVNNKLTGYCLYGGKIGVAWTAESQCYNQPTVINVGSTSRVFCNGFNTKETTSFSYAGVAEWHQPLSTDSTFPVQAYAATDVFVQEKNSIIGLTVNPSATDAPGVAASSGPSAGVVVLIIFMLVFVVILAGAIWKVVSVKTARRTASRASIDKEGYAGLNA